MSANSFGSKAALEVGGRSYDIFRIDALQSRFDVGRLRRVVDRRERGRARGGRRGESRGDRTPWRWRRLTGGESNERDCGKDRAAREWSHG